VRQLSSLARPGDERWERTNLAQILDEVVRLVSFDRRARKVEIDFELPKSLPLVYTLRSQLQQVFINLALNAFDAMSDGGKLTIRAEKQRGSIVVRIEDTGCGIPAEVGRRVFEPFFTTKEPGVGTGLGLSVSYGIIQKHGGRIDFSQSLKGGTVFTVEIPILDKAPAA
jgi:two-component system NtrC family sensor kinase